MQKKIEKFQTLFIGSLLSSTQLFIGMIHQMATGGKSLCEVCWDF